MKIFLYGEDRFRLLEKLKNIKEEFFYKNTANALLGVFDFGEKEDLVEFKKSFRSEGLFTQKKLIIIKNFSLIGDKKMKEDFYDFLENSFEKITDENTDLVFYEENLPAKNEKIFKWLLKNIKTEEFKKLNENQIKEWINKKFLSFDIKVDDEIINKLLEYCGNDLFLINNEISKISNYLSDSTAINLLEIDNLLSSKIEADIFKTIEFLSSGNKKKALEMLHKQLDKGDDSFYILSMYVYQFRNLLKIADFHFKGVDNNFEIAKLAKLHPFVVQKGIQQLRGLNLSRLKNIYKSLEKIDIEAKTGKQEIKIGLELFIANL